MTYQHTSDVYDELGEKTESLNLNFQSLGARPYFEGTVRTVRVFEDNQLLKGLMEEPGNGNILIVDGAEQLTCALMGGNMAARFAANGWAGVIISGAVRDRHEIAETDLGVLALGSNPKRSRKEGHGEVDVPVVISGVLIRPGAYAYADADGVLVTRSDEARG